MAQINLRKKIEGIIRTIGLTLLILFASQSTTYSQVSDTALMRIHYFSASKNFSDSKGKKEDWHCLDIGKIYSRFYSMNAKLIDSTKSVLVQQGLSPEEVFLKTRSMSQGSADIITKDYTNWSIGFVSTILAQDYFYAEPLEITDWELLNDTLTILNYKCYKARKEFRGRTWEVWYAPSIPSMDGPWKLAGLPGLILKAQDSAGDFSFECNGISIPANIVAIPNPLEQKNRRVITTDGKTYLQMKRKSIEDLKGTVAARGFTIVSVTDEKGVESDIPKRKMNSIEEYD